MPDVDPYVSPPQEPIPRSRLAPLRPWLAGAAVVLLFLAWAAVGAFHSRQDPSLQAPEDALPAGAPEVTPPVLPTGGTSAAPTTGASPPAPVSPDGP